MGQINSMPSPLGIIVSPNINNPQSCDEWALVLNNTVMNTILDSTSDIIDSWVIGAYDYIIDMTVLGQFAGPGNGYDPANKVFIYPPTPPPDYNQYVQADIDSVATALIQCIMDAGPQGGALTTQQIQAAFAAAVEDTQANYTQNQMALMNTILTYILSGG